MGEPESESETSSSGTVKIGILAVAALFVVSGAVAFGYGPLGVVDGPAQIPPNSSPASTGPSDERVGEPADDSDRDQEFAFVVESIEDCGATCRNVTASLTNIGREPRRNVTVTTELYAESDRIWTGEQRLGSVAPNETKIRTRRVEIGYTGAAKIYANDGNVTFVTTVEWDGGNATYRDTRTVI